jgi:hypothetical protein
MGKAKNDEEMLATGQTSIEDSRPEQKKEFKKGSKPKEVKDYPVAAEISECSDFVDSLPCKLGLCTKLCMNFNRVSVPVKGGKDRPAVRCSLQLVDVEPRVVCMPWLRSVQGALQAAEAAMVESKAGIEAAAVEKASLEAKVKATEDLYRRDGCDMRREVNQLRTKLDGAEERMKRMEEDVIQGDLTISHLGNKLKELQEFTREKHKYENILEKKNEEIDKIKPRLAIVERENARLAAEDRAKDARIVTLERNKKTSDEYIKTLEKRLEVSKSRESAIAPMEPKEKEEAQPNA